MPSTARINRFNELVIEGEKNASYPTEFVREAKRVKGKPQRYIVGILEEKGGPHFYYEALEHLMTCQNRSQYIIHSVSERMQIAKAQREENLDLKAENTAQIH